MGLLAEVRDLISPWVGAWVERRRLRKRIAGVESQMPTLFAEMRVDLKKNPLCREFILQRKGTSYWGDPNHQILVYYFGEHANLKNKVELLVNMGLCDDIAYNKVDRYRLSEELVAYLQERGEHG